MRVQEGKQVDWESHVLANSSDGYSKAVIDFAIRWADLIEESLANGISISECADEDSHRADTEGITGFMFGCAVSSLTLFWEHGEELRIWHNLKTQIGNEGEIANKTGGVLNPALISFS